MLLTMVWCSGLDTAAWAFSPADQTSPALAAQAGALFDTAPSSGRVTELRIHGVSGSDGPTMLEHPAALQVAGDMITGFYRRWNPEGEGRPSVGWKLEAYSWGGLTERPLASAAWLLLAPFMIYNLAHFMLPAEPERELEQPEPKPSWRYQLAPGALRLLALAATLQFVTAVATVTVSTVAWQAAGHPGVLPQWMGWYAICHLVSHDGRDHWRSAVRRTDYIGSWIFSPPSPVRTQEHLKQQFDQLCWDPVVLAADTEPTPPPVHRHSAWWPDPRAAEIASYLVDLLPQPYRFGCP